MIDFLGSKIYVGDTVAVVRAHKNSRTFLRGEVVRFTKSKKQAVIKYLTPESGFRYYGELIRFPDEVIVLNKNLDNIILDRTYHGFEHIVDLPKHLENSMDFIRNKYGAEFKNSIRVLIYDGGIN